MFIACHPILAVEARVALTLRLLGGLTTPEIARAFLVPEPTVAQRIVRAKRTLSEARVPFEVPDEAERAERLSSVLEVIYLVFNEGYSATAGDDWMRPALCEDALRLGRVLAELTPNEPEVHGLVALMEIQASRSHARIGPGGEPVLLLDQDRGRWDHLLIQRGLAALARAEVLGGAHGPYALQAAIAACHARAREPEATDWARIAALYDALAQLTPSPVVELNRAVALAMAFGPAVGLELVDALVADGSLDGYHLLPSVRGDLLAKLGRIEEASIEFARRGIAHAEHPRARAAPPACRCPERGTGPVAGRTCHRTCHQWEPTQGVSTDATGLHGMIAQLRQHSACLNGSRTATCQGADNPKVVGSNPIPAHHRTAGQRVRGLLAFGRPCSWRASVEGYLVPQSSRRIAGGGDRSQRAPCRAPARRRGRRVIRGSEPRQPTS